MEANLLIKNFKIKPEKKATIKQESSSSYDGKHDTLIKMMETKMDRMTIENKRADPSIRNPNYRDKFIKKHKEQKYQDPQGQIRTPFQKNYTQGLEEDEEEIAEGNNFFEEYELPTILTKEYQFSQESPAPSDKHLVLINEDSWAIQIEEYQQGYQNALVELIL